MSSKRFVASFPLCAAVHLALGYLCSLLRDGHPLPRWTSLRICSFRGACPFTSRRRPRQDAIARYADRLWVSYVRCEHQDVSHAYLCRDPTLNRIQWRDERGLDARHGTVGRGAQLPARVQVPRSPHRKERVLRASAAPSHRSGKGLTMYRSNTSWMS